MAEQKEEERMAWMGVEGEAENSRSTASGDGNGSMLLAVKSSEFSPKPPGNISFLII